MPNGADAAPATPALPGEMLREEIVSQLAVLSILADLASGHAFVGDDLATNYCLRRITALLRFIIAVAGDLAEQYPTKAGRDEKEWTIEEPRYE